MTIQYNKKVRSNVNIKYRVPSTEFNILPAKTCSLQGRSVAIFTTGLV